MIVGLCPYTPPLRLCYRSCFPAQPTLSPDGDCYPRLRRAFLVLIIRGADAPQPPYRSALAITHCSLARATLSPDADCYPHIFPFLLTLPTPCGAKRRCQKSTGYLFRDCLPARAPLSPGGDCPSGFKKVARRIPPPEVPARPVLQKQSAPWAFKGAWRGLICPKSASTRGTVRAIFSKVNCYCGIWAK